MMMMYSLKSGSRLDLYEFLLSGMNTFVVFAFVFMFYDDLKQAPGEAMFRAVAISAALGFAMGLYIKYRSTLSSVYAVCMATYFVIAMNILFIGAACGSAVIFAGRPDLRWFAFNSNVGCMLLTLLIGMLLEAKKLGVLKGESRWHEEIGKYLDYSKRLVDPAITTDTSNSNQFLNPYLIIGAGIGTIPLLFQMFTGDQNNAIFLVAPLGMATFSYMNFIIYGPGLVRIFLLLKIEKEQGFRFLNTDYEEVQRMRHDFAQAPSLMKDYDPTIREANREARNAMKKRQRLHEQKWKSKR